MPHPRRSAPVDVFAARPTGDTPVAPLVDATTEIGGATHPGAEGGVGR